MKFLFNTNFIRNQIIFIFIICHIVCYEEKKYTDNFNIPLSYYIPQSIDEKETFGVSGKIKIFDNKFGKYTFFNMLIDMQSSSFWVFSSYCDYNDCRGKAKLTPNRNYGSCELYYNMGVVMGIIDNRTVHLNSLVLENQPVFLIDKIHFPLFARSSYDGYLGLSHIFSPLHHKSSFESITQGIEKLIKNDKITDNVYVILKLGGQNPYLKFYFLEEFDNYHIRNTVEGKKETIYWIRLFDKSKIMLALKHVNLKFYNKDNLIKEEIAVTDCLDTGCRVLLDTKSYFMYGPKSHISKLKKLSSACNDLDNMPDMEFSFFDVEQSSKTSFSTVELTLFPSEYFVSNNDDENCVPGILDHETDYGWNLGILFMRQFMVLYDFKSGYLGFVRVKKESDE